MKEIPTVGTNFKQLSSCSRLVAAGGLGVGGDNQQAWHLVGVGGGGDG